MKRKVLQFIVQLLLFGIFVYLAAAVSLGTIQIYDKLMGK